MFVSTIHTPGLASLSYVIGDGGEAAVIDPRRDVGAYLDLARERGLAIRQVFETHRNEDFVVGSRELAARVKAPILHGDALDFGYGEGVSHGQTFEVGEVSLEVLHTPGHTDESISIVARHRATGDSPLAVFTGDALFVGDVGRTDFYPERAREVAGLLYDSLHARILPLGDQCVLHPAHGAGSVCGSGMADRNSSTLGYERRHNPKLQLDREAFIEAKLAEHHEQPPYFATMEKLNREGPPIEAPRRDPRAVGVDDLRRLLRDGAQVVDVREPQAFSGSHVPGSLSIPEAMLPAYAGWLLTYHAPLAVVADDRAQVERARAHLWRLGFEVDAWFQPGVTGWETSGREPGAIAPMSAHRLRAKLGDVRVLDVRKIGEWQSGHLPGARHVFLGRLPEALDDLPRDRPIVTFCGSGRRAMIAASLLRRAGYDDVFNCFGSMAAWQTIDGPVEKPADAGR